MKKKTKAWYKKKATELAKTIAKERDDYTCQYCGQTRDTRQIHASHVYSVGSCDFLRADPENIKALCSYHHRRWWHSSPLEATEWFNEMFPERAKSLKEKIKNHKSGTIDWEKIYNELKGVDK
jgi:5-methylcytosine-specific restriction endonuclease McrA